MNERAGDVQIADTADVAASATIGAGSTIWHLAQVREEAVLGENCVVGRGAYVGSGVVIGDNCKLQNHALVYEPAVLHDGVFVGPAVVFTNDHYPRAVTSDGALEGVEEWFPVWVVVRDVPDFAVMDGVPARRIGWCRAGKCASASREAGTVAVAGRREILRRGRRGPHHLVCRRDPCTREPRRDEAP